MQRIVDALARTGELDNTLIVFTSDNGFVHGEHRITYGKNRALRGVDPGTAADPRPGLPAGRQVDDLAANVDLAPTILDAGRRAAPGCPRTAGRCCR